MNRENPMLKSIHAQVVYCTVVPFGPLCSVECSHVTLAIYKRYNSTFSCCKKSVMTVYMCDEAYNLLQVMPLIT